MPRKRLVILSRTVAAISPKVRGQVAHQLRQNAQSAQGRERQVVTDDFVVFGVALYFVACCIGMLWWSSPSLRARVSGGLLRVVDHRGGQARHWGARACGVRPLAVVAALRNTGGRTSSSVAPGLQARGWLVSMVLLCGLPSVAWLGRQWHGYDGFDHTASRAVNPQVAALLHGEQLVAPPPLPPELFLTREVQSALPLVASASRQWELLDADFRQRLLVVFKVMREEHRYDMVLIEGYRSAERQAALAALGPAVTRAGAGRSYHQHGLAADCAFLIDGRIVVSEQDPRAARGYELYGQVAQSLGLVWGGRWKSLKDIGHVELRRAGVMDPARREENQE
jgi:peptidoglycan LD-endopeptidase CwlK